MQDIRLERWAHTLVHYSLHLAPGETVSIRTTPLAAPLVEAVYREVLRNGGEVWVDDTLFLKDGRIVI